MMLYRFRQENSQESSQTSWVRWRVPFPEVLYVPACLQDKLFVAVKVSDSPDKGILFVEDGQRSVVEGLPANPGNSLNLIVPKYMDGWTHVPYYRR